MGPHVIDRGARMAMESCRVFGAGRGANDLCFIGWTRRSLESETDQIFLDLVASNCPAVVRWMRSGVRRQEIDLFGIEPATSIQDAKCTAAILGRYFRSLGLEVTADDC